MSGVSAWICRSASWPFRAVPTTRKSGDPSMISPMTRRMKALSSTTSTVARPLEDTISLLERPHLDAAVAQVEIHAAPVVESRVFGDDRDLRDGESLAGGDDVPLAHVDARAVHELAEHARAPGDLRGDARVRRYAERTHLGEHDRHDRLRELRGVRRLARHRRARQQDVRERAGPSVPVVEHDRDARSETDRGDDVAATPHRVVG